MLRLPRAIQGNGAGVVGVVGRVRGAKKVAILRILLERIRLGITRLETTRLGITKLHVVIRLAKVIRRTKVVVFSDGHKLRIRMRHVVEMC